VVDFTGRLLRSAVEALGTIGRGVQFAVADRATNVRGLPTLVALEKHQHTKQQLKDKNNMRIFVTE